MISVRLYDPEDSATHEALGLLFKAHGINLPEGTMPLNGALAFDDLGLLGCWWLIGTDGGFGLLENIMFRPGAYIEEAAQMMADLLETIARQKGLHSVMTFGPAHLCDRAVATRGYVKVGEKLTAIYKVL